MHTRLQDADGEREFPFLFLSTKKNLARQDQRRGSRPEDVFNDAASNNEPVFEREFILRNVQAVRASDKHYDMTSHSRRRGQFIQLCHIRAVFFFHVWK